MKKFLKLALASFLFLLAIFIIAGGGFGNNAGISVGNNRPVLFAHRGVVRKNIVENTKEAFLLSQKYNFNAIETDLNITKDGKLIIFHDDSLKRLLHINKALKDVNWDEIKDKTLYKNNKPTRQKILTLEELLSILPSHTIIYLDIKTNTKRVADSLLRTLQKYPGYQNIMIADESLSFLNYLRYKGLNRPVILEQFNQGKEWLYYVIPKNFKPDYYAGFLDKTGRKQISFLKKKNLLNKKIVYIINMSNLQKSIDMGLKNLIIDYDENMGSLNEISQKIMDRTNR